jgi:hypothetical protein
MVRDGDRFILEFGEESGFRPEGFDEGKTQGLIDYWACCALPKHCSRYVEYVRNAAVIDACFEDSHFRVSVPERMTMKALRTFLLQLFAVKENSGFAHVYGGYDMDAIRYRSRRYGGRIPPTVRLEVFQNVKEEKVMKSKRIVFWISGDGLRNSGEMQSHLFGSSVKAIDLIRHVESQSLCSVGSRMRVVALTQRELCVREAVENDGELEQLGNPFRVEMVAEGESREDEIPVFSDEFGSTISFLLVMEKDESFGSSRSRIENRLAHAVPELFLSDPLYRLKCRVSGFEKIMVASDRLLDVCEALDDPVLHIVKRSEGRENRVHERLRDASVRIYN